MADDTAHTDPRKSSQGCFTCLVVAVALAAILIVGGRYLRQRARIASERQRAEWREKWFQHVKRGNQQGHVLDGELLPMLAADADCIKNLDSLWFAMVEITPDQAGHVSRLVNLRSIAFYDMNGADHVLAHSHELPIEELSFDGTVISHASLRSLAEFPKLKNVYFTYDLPPDQMAILKSLPERISVETGCVR